MRLTHRRRCWQKIRIQTNCSSLGLDHTKVAIGWACKDSIGQESSGWIHKSYLFLSHSQCHTLIHTQTLTHWLTHSHLHTLIKQVANLTTMDMIGQERTGWVLKSQFSLSLTCIHSMINQSRRNVAMWDLGRSWLVRRGLDESTESTFLCLSLCLSRTHSCVADWIGANVIGNINWISSQSHNRVAVGWTWIKSICQEKDGWALESHFSHSLTWYDWLSHPTSGWL